MNEPEGDELVDVITTILNGMLRQLNELPAKQAGAAAMTAILTLSERVLQNSVDPDLTFLMLMHSMKEVYDETVHPEKEKLRGKPQ